MAQESKATFKLTKIKNAHLSSVTCLNWSPALPNRIISGSEDKFIKIWDIRTKDKKCGLSLNLSEKGEVCDIESNHHIVWAATSDCKCYQFDVRMIRQKKDFCHFAECKDEISQICFDEACNALFIADDLGNVTKYNFASNKVSQSVLFHNNALCTSVSTIASLNIGFCGGTDAMLHQFSTKDLKNAYSYSMNDLISQNEDQNGTKSQLQINPRFVYSLDCKALESSKNAKQGIVALALGNGFIALYAPTINEKNDENDDVNDPICCMDVHKSAVCDISFGIGNEWIVSVGTDKLLMINEWKLNEKDNALAMNAKYKIPLNEKPNSMICTSNEMAQIVIADLSNTLSMYALKS